MRNGTSQGCVYFLGVAAFVPDVADFSTVFVKCDLLPVESHHPNCCALDATPEDPARRLGIIVSYTSRADHKGHVMWNKQSCLPRAGGPG